MKTIAAALALFVLSVLSVLCASAAAQNYPSKPIRVISEYIAGAGGLLAVEAVSRATPDGYTVLLASQIVPVTRR